MNIKYLILIAVLFSSGLVVAGFKRKYHNEFLLKNHLLRTPSKETLLTTSSQPLGVKEQNEDTNQRPAHEPRSQRSFDSKHQSSGVQPVAPSDGATKTNPRVNIIGGDAALPDRWQWAVALVTDQYDIGFFCGATIIHPQWVLTAGHCVNDATGTMYALIGTWNLTASDYKDKVAVEEIIVHPKYELRQSSMYDIALLKLARESNVTDSPDNILTLPNILFNLFELNPYCYIIGWGVTEPGSTILSPVLRQHRVNVITSVECQRRWDEGYMPVEIANTNICIDEGVNGDISSCFGDSGSPLQCFDISDNVWKMAGLASWGSGACSTYPSVYTKVQAFLDWIYFTIYGPEGLFGRTPRNMANAGGDN